MFFQHLQSATVVFISFFVFFNSVQVQAKMSVAECVQHGTVAALNALLRSGESKADELDRNDIAPIVYAVVQRDLEKVDLLLQAGANPLWRSPFGGASLLHLLCERNDSCMVAKSVAIIKKLIAANEAIVFLRNDRSENALDHCAQESYYYSAKAILESVCTNTRLKIVNGSDSPLKITPLHHAVRNVSESMVMFLLRCGAVKNTPDHLGKVPLDYLPTPKYLDRDCAFSYGYKIRYIQDLFASFKERVDPLEEGLVAEFAAVDLGD